MPGKGAFPPDIEHSLVDSSCSEVETSRSEREGEAQSSRAGSVLSMDNVLGPIRRSHPPQELGYFMPWDPNDNNVFISQILDSVAT